MNAEKFTQKSLEALKSAQAEATRRRHQAVDTPHLLFALLEQEQGLVPRLLEKAGIQPAIAKARTAELLDRIPSVSGAAGAEADKILVSQELNEVLVKAEDTAKQLRDEFVSVEHLLLAMLATDGPSGTSRALRNAGLSEGTLLKVLKEVRGSQRVTTDSPEEQYEALKKYGTDLVAMARDGKLDPVIGRDAEIRSVVRILSRKTKNNPVLIG